MKLSLLNRLRRRFFGTRFVFVRDSYGHWKQKKWQTAPDGLAFVTFDDYPDTVVLYMDNGGTFYRIFRGERLPQPNILWRHA